jgi:hypothetical protein
MQKKPAATEQIDAWILLVSSFSVYIYTTGIQEKVKQE